MPAFFLRRLCYSVLVLWGSATLLFAFFNAKADGPAAPATPILTRYGGYLNDLSPIGVTSSAKGSRNRSSVRIVRLQDSNYLSLKTPYLGRSQSANQPVTKIIQKALPGTIMLALIAALIASTVGIFLGLLTAMKQGTVRNTGAMGILIAGFSMPAFFIALLIAYLFGHLALHNFVLPAIAASIRPIAIVAQITRNAMQDVLSQENIPMLGSDYLRTARVLLRRMVPQIAEQTVKDHRGLAAEILVGVAIAEYIFGRNGLGSITIEALRNRDIAVVAGAALLAAFSLIVLRLATDLLYGLLKPRTRLT